MVCRPKSRDTIGISQFTETSLSPPRAPVCCESTTKALPCSNSVQFPKDEWIIGVDSEVERGSRLVPEDREPVEFSIADIPGMIICPLTTPQPRTTTLI